MSETLTQTLARNPLAASALAQGDGLSALDVSATGLAKDAVLTIAELVKALSATNASANSTGNTTITPHACAVQHTEVLTLTGSAGTRIIILATSANPLAGARVSLRLALPATAAIIVEVRNATSGGTLLASLETDGSGSAAALDFYYTGSAWALLSAIYPTL